MTNAAPAAPAAPAQIELPPEPVVAEKPSAEALKESGLSQAEIKSAQKHGLAAEDKAKPEDKPASEKPAGDNPAEGSQVEKPADAAAAAAKADLPADFNRYTPNEKALYWEQKRARARAQRAEVNNEHLQLQNRTALAELEKTKAELEKLRAGNKAAPAAPAARDAKDPLDALLDPDKPAAPVAAVDEKDKPLTRADLERIEKERADQAAKTSEERAAQAKVLQASLNVFETEAKATIQDFDPVTDLANEILKKGKEVFVVDGKLDNDHYEMALLRARRAMFALTNAHQWDQVVEKYPELKGKTPATLVYELGQLHPQYKAASAAVAPPEKTGTESPEDVQRMLDNASRRSSASAGAAGGTRVVPESEITPEQAARLTAKQYAKLSKATRERLKRMG